MQLRIQILYDRKKILIAISHISYYFFCFFTPCGVCCVGTSTTTTTATTKLPRKMEIQALDNSEPDIGYGGGKTEILQPWTLSVISPITTMDHLHFQVTTLRFETLRTVVKFLILCEEFQLRDSSLSILNSNLL